MHQGFVFFFVFIVFLYRSSKIYSTINLWPVQSDTSKCCAGIVIKSILRLSGASNTFRMFLLYCEPSFSVQTTVQCSHKTILDIRVSHK